MHQNPKNLTINYQNYTPNANNPDQFYGLPQHVEFCAECVISNQRPNSTVEFQHTKDSKKKTIHFNEQGICSACMVAKQKNSTIDWQKREAELVALCDKFRSRNGSHDCVVPGSGGKDSFYASHVLRYKYNMHPLSVTWAPHIYTPWGQKNFQSWIHSGFDNYLCTPNGRAHRLLTRLAVENLFHPFQPFILGQKNLAPKMANLFKIPLVFYGENEAEYGNPIEDTSQAERDFKYFTALDESQMYLGGESVHALKTDYDLSQADLQTYLPANPEETKQNKTQVHYLGYYLKWHPQSCYYYSVEHGGFIPSPERTPGTYSKYNSIDDKIDDFHYYTTFIKFGIGRATYDASQEIRSMDIDRDEGIALIKRFDGEFPSRFADEIFAYLSINPDQFPKASAMFEQPIMDREYFDNLANKFRSPHLWQFSNGAWQLRKQIFS